jgi:CheY-like chemotaxis protein
MQRTDGSGQRWRAARRGRILVVDDEPHVGHAIARLLEGEHDVTVVTQARAALALLRPESPFDVIFCDIVMPGMDGLLFHQAVRRHHPDQVDRIVFVTGGLFRGPATALLRTLPNAIVDKPPDPEALRRLVRERVTAVLEGVPLDARTGIR